MVSHAEHLATLLAQSVRRIVEDWVPFEQLEEDTQKYLVETERYLRARVNKAEVVALCQLVRQYSGQE
jgi:hypothetical protein